MSQQKLKSHAGKVWSLRLPLTDPGHRGANQRGVSEGITTRSKHAFNAQVNAPLLLPGGDLIQGQGSLSCCVSVKGSMKGSPG